MLWLIVLASLGGYVMYVHVARTQGATVVSTLLYLTPPTTMLWVYLMFGVPVHLAGFVGSGDQRRRRVVLVLRGRRSASPQEYRTGTCLTPLIQPWRSRTGSPVRSMSGILSAITLNMISTSSRARLAPMQ